MMQDYRDELEIKPVTLTVVRAIMPWNAAFAQMPLF
jgi:hypothetical protein